MTANRRHIESLVGEELSAVSFVRDYVEFHFDGPVLRALTNPIVCDAKAQHRFPDPGSRDALCGLIDSVVSQVTVEPGFAIELRFVRNTVLSIPLDDAARRGPEAAHFMGELIHSPLDVW